MSTFADLLLQRAGDPRPALLAGDDRWSWDEVVRESAARGAAARALLRPDRPQHIGVLLENVPEFAFWIGGAALAGITVVGINPTRRGPDLARDVHHTDCQLVITDGALAPLLEDVAADVPRLCIDAPDYARLVGEHAGTAPDAEPQEADRLLLLFTSGSTGAPKAVVCSQGRLVHVAHVMAEVSGHTADTVAYMAMPLYHGNSLMANYAAMVAVGGTVAMRPRFSVSAFLPDVRRYEATFFNYVGRALAYLLTLPERPDDAENPLRLVYGTEASHQDRERFSRRFGCRWIETYGSSEGPIVLRPTGDTPPGSLGVPWGGQDVVIAQPGGGADCPPARFDGAGRLLNADAAVGEIVGRGMGHLSEGYYDNPEATAERVRGGDVWTGDLGYRDEAGFFYFAGRAADRLRVDSENFGAAPVERLLMRLPGIVMAAVFPVPDPRTGDQVMAALELRDGVAFDPERFARFLSEQPDLGTKWAPRFVRIVESMPLTPTNKVFKPPLRREAWRTSDPLFWRPPGEDAYRPLTDSDRAAIDAEFAAHGRGNPFAAA